MLIKLKIDKKHRGKNRRAGERFEVPTDTAIQWFISGIAEYDAANECPGYEAMMIQSAQPVPIYEVKG